jgi:hypothetical protein
MNRERVIEILHKLEPLTEEDFTELRKGSCMLSLSYAPPSVADVLHIRTSIELLTAIRKFDRTSGELVNTTNLLTEKVRKLTVMGTVFAGIAAILAGVAVWLTLLSYQLALSQVSK